MGPNRNGGRFTLVPIEGFTFVGKFSPFIELFDMSDEQQLRNIPLQPSKKKSRVSMKTCLHATNGLRKSSTFSGSITFDLLLKAGW